MSSLLAFAWRQKGSHPTQNGQAFSPYDLPGVTFSSSGENEETGIDASLRCPGTPEGLRPRKSAESIRRALNIPSDAPNPIERHPEQPDQSKTFWVAANPIKEEVVGPPPPPSFWQMRSPQISTSSFYSSSSVPTRGVAVSPNLKMGHARTAVGALLAMTEASRGESSPQVSDVYHNDSSHYLGVLPPRTWINDERQEDHESACSDLPYQALNDSVDRFASGKKRRSRIPGSPCSSADESTQHASPSSNNFGRLRNDGKQTQYRQEETSFSRGWLMEQEAMAGERYDFETIVDQELDEQLFAAQAPENGANVSAISGSTKELESLSSFDDEDEDQHYFYQSMQPEEEELGEELLRQNTKLQCEVKENLLGAIIVRLQDNTELFQDALKKMDLPGQREGIVTGFSKKTRATVCRNIDAVLHERTVGTSNDILLSPTDDLQHALMFCRASVVGAVPELEKREINQRIEGRTEQLHRWKCLPALKLCLGFEEVRGSPETVRGGDTSLFSLPSDSANTSTPHTSNVSMTTTITSACSPNRTLRSTLRQQDGVRLRRTVEATVTLLDRLSSACAKLGRLTSTSNEASIKATEEIKGVYLQLLAIRTDELSALIDSFSLDRPPVKIARLVSEERNDQMLRSHGTTAFLPPPPVVLREAAPPAYSSVQPFPMPTGNTGVRPEYANIIADDHRANLFSPSTTDMNSIENRTFVDDDLRRDTGSFDREDVNVEREPAPSAEQSSQHEERKKRKSGKWRKSRLFFKSKASE